MKKLLLAAALVLGTSQVASAFANSDHVVYTFLTGDTDICGGKGYESLEDSPPVCVYDTSFDPPFLSIGAPVYPDNWNVFMPQCNSADGGEPFIFANTGTGTITVNAENDIFGVETIDGAATHVVNPGEIAHVMCDFNVDLNIGEWITVPTFG